MNNIDKMNTLSFVNKEELNPISFSVIGASAKTSNDCIGFYGSGLKYAIAVMMRNNIKFKINTHGKEYKFSSTKQDFRGTEMNIITCNGKELGYTTDLGQTWSLEQAFRELYCNTLDEGGTVELGGSVSASEQTVISVDDHRMVEEYHNRLVNFKFDDKPKIVTGSVQAFELKDDDSSRVFYKGVKTQSHHKKMMFDYNVTCKLDLTEDRTIESLYEWGGKVSEFWRVQTNKTLLRKMMTLGEEYLEDTLDYYSWHSYSDEFMEVAVKLQRQNKLQNNKIISMLMEKEPKAFEREAKELNKKDKAMLQNAFKMLEDNKFYVQGYEVKKFKSENPNVLGQAKDNTIFLSELLFKHGPRELMVTILEEFWHLKYGFRDETRNFQNHLFTELGKKMEEISDLKEKLNYQLAS